MKPWQIALALSAVTLFAPACRRAPGGSPAAPPFRNIAKEAGLAYRWTLPGKTPRTLLDTIGNGAAFLDFDADGHLDILLVGKPCALFRGDGTGKFADVSSEAGLTKLSQTYAGVAVGDFDADGFPDLYLTAYRGGTLLHNEGGKLFRDVTPQAEIPAQPWGTAADFVDLDGDGRLDLIVGNYVRYEPEKGTRTLCEQRDASGKTIAMACGPIEYDPLKPNLYHNLDGRRFTSQPDTSSKLRGRCLGIAAAPPEKDGRPAVAFANDELPGDLLEPDGSNSAEQKGVAYDRDGRAHGGMGLDWGDFDGDGTLDLAVATYRLEAKSLYRNRDGSFVDDTYFTGVGALTKPYVAFGCKFLDFDNDGNLDLAFANGHTQDNIADLVRDATLRQPSQLLRNRGDGTFVDAKPGVDYSIPLVGRGLSTGDFNDDGRTDLLIVDSDGEPHLLRNDAPGGHWLGLRLMVGNRDALGARVTVTAGGRKFVRHCHADGSYLSSSDPRIVVGLGDATRIDSIEIGWPDGRVGRIPPPPAVDRYLIVRTQARATAGSPPSPPSLPAVSLK